MNHKGRLVAFAALGHGREIWCVGFDQQTIERHAAGCDLQIGSAFESQNARQRNIEAEAKRMGGELLA